MGIWCLHVAPIKDRTVINIYLYKSVPMLCFHFSCGGRRSRIAELCSNSGLLKSFTLDETVWLPLRPLDRSELQTSTQSQGEKSLTRVWLSKGLHQGPHVKPSEWNLTHRKYSININYSLLSFSWLLRIIQNWGHREKINCWDLGWHPSVSLTVDLSSGFWRLWL